MGTVCIPMTLWLTTVLSVPVEDLNNSTRGEDEINEDDVCDREDVIDVDIVDRDDAGHTSRFLPCWIIILVRIQTIVNLI